MPNYIALAKVKCDLTGIPEKWITDALNLEGIYIVTKNLKSRRATLETLQKYGGVLPEMDAKIRCDTALLEHFAGIKTLRGFIGLKEVETDQFLEYKTEPIYTAKTVKINAHITNCDECDDLIYNGMCFEILT